MMEIADYESKDNNNNMTEDEIDIILKHSQPIISVAGGQIRTAQLERALKS